MEERNEGFREVRKENRERGKGRERKRESIQLLVYSPNVTMYYCTKPEPEPKTHPDTHMDADLTTWAIIYCSLTLLRKNTTWLSV